MAGCKRCEKPGSRKVKLKKEDLVYCVYNGGNRGQHKVPGPATGHIYGPVGRGEKMYAHYKDVAAAPHLFQRVTPQAASPVRRVATPVARSEARPPVVAPQGAAPGVDDSILEDFIPAPQPVRTLSTFDPQVIPGVTANMANQLLAPPFAVTSKHDVLSLGVEGLQRVKGIGDAKAASIIELLTAELGRAEEAKVEAPAQPEVKLDPGVLEKLQEGMEEGPPQVIE